jgi:hypothetical protein
VSAVFELEEERQAAYDFLESRKVPERAVVDALRVSTARSSASEAQVYIPVDGSSLTLVDRVGDKGFGSIGQRRLPTRGLKVVTALAVATSGVPIGVAGLQWWARGVREKRRRRLDRHDRTETAQWLENIEHIEAAYRRHAPETARWYVLDREGDNAEVLQRLRQMQAHFTVRSKHDRPVLRGDGRRSRLSTVAARGKWLGSYVVDVPAAPQRRARRAVVEVRAERVTVLLPNYEHRLEPIAFELTVLLARERHPPRGCPRLQWRLLTDQPVRNRVAALCIIGSYCTRWRIEEFHRTWKSGACNVEDSRLRARAHVVRWATVLAAVAARTERLKYLARNDPEQPATVELTPLEIEALIAAKRRQKSSVEVVPDGVPTIRQAVRWIADLGGWGDARYRKGAEPGTITIARGLERLMIWADAWAFAQQQKTPARRHQR